MGVNGSDLFAQHPGSFAVYDDLGPKRRRTSRGRGWNDDDCVEQPEFVALDDDGVAATGWLSPRGATEPNAAHRSSSQLGQGASSSSRSLSASSRARRSSGSMARRATSARSVDRRRRRAAASASANRTASDSVPPSRSNSSKSASALGLRRALTVRDAIPGTVAQAVAQNPTCSFDCLLHSVCGLGRLSGACSRRLRRSTDVGRA